VKITPRLKILLAMTAAVVIFIVVTRRSAAPEDAQVVEVAKPAGAHAVPTRPAVPAPAAGQARAGRVADSSAAASLFRPITWYVPPPPPPPPPPQAPAPPPPPTAPPLPFTVMGSYSHPGDAKTYFLMRGEKVFDVHVGDTIDGIYSVDGEANGQLLFTFKPLKIQQALALAGSQ
jgi:hypothetical protein